MVNQTRSILPYAQAVLLDATARSSYKAVAISDISMVDATSPYVAWVEEAALELSTHTKEPMLVENKKHLTSKTLKAHSEFAPQNILAIPLRLHLESGEVEYMLLLFREQIFKESDLELAKHLSNSFAFFLFGLRRCGVFEQMKKISLKSRYAQVTLVLLFLLMFVPVRLSVLAPLEVSAKEPYVVTSPLNAVVEEVKVLPNQKIQKGDLIVAFDAVEFTNSYEVAKRSLDVAKAELFSAAQSSFLDPKLKAQIAQLQTQVRLKEAELVYAKEQLAKTKLHAKEGGVAIINDPKEWSGKPLSTGERILLIADEKEVVLKIMLPVSDAIFLEEGAEVRAFFDNDPINSWNAKVTQISYKPQLSDENILSYTITAVFDDMQANGYAPSIGLRGSAKIYSKRVSLFFYLFRKPITALRQWIGW